jgi:hypothetical protein
VPDGGMFRLREDHTVADPIRFNRGATLMRSDDEMAKSHEAFQQVHDDVVDMAWTDSLRLLFVLDAQGDSLTQTERASPAKGHY